MLREQFDVTQIIRENQNDVFAAHSTCLQERCGTVDVNNDKVTLDGSIDRRALSSTALSRILVIQCGNDDGDDASRFCVESSKHFRLFCHVSSRRRGQNAKNVVASGSNALNPHRGLAGKTDNGVSERETHRVSKAISRGERTPPSDDGARCSTLWS